MRSSGQGDFSVSLTEPPRQGYAESVDDVGGRPSPDDWEPDDDRGGADEDFATVAFDEDFVRAAKIHEPTAVERLVAAAEARAETEAARPRSAGGGRDGDPYDHYGPGYGGGRSGPPDPDDLDYDPDHDFGTGPYGPHGGVLRPYRGSARWHRPIAWLLALVMGIGMIALAFSAVYRGASADSQDHVPPTTSGVDAAATDPAAPDDGQPGAARPAVPDPAGPDSAGPDSAADSDSADSVDGVVGSPPPADGESPMSSGARIGAPGAGRGAPGAPGSLLPSASVGRSLPAVPRTS